MALTFICRAALELGVLGVGIAFGGGFAMITALTADCFGAKHFASNYGAVDLAPSLIGSSSRWDII